MQMEVIKTTLKNLVSSLVDEDFILENQLDPKFANVVAKICEEISKEVSTEEKVNFVQDDLDNWKLELMSFLRELQCPYDFNDRFEVVSERHLVLDFLTTELISAKKVSQKMSSKPNLTNLKPLFGILQALGLSQPPANISINALFIKFHERIQTMPSGYKAIVLAQPLFCGLALNEAQWKEIDSIAMKLESEYSLRRTMLITRLRATLQSFSWSDRAKKMPRHVTEAVASIDFNRCKFSNITTADILAARKDILSLRKIASDPPESRNARNSLTKIKVGRVPDRGGRPSEMAAPAPEMPSWQQRSGQPHSAKNFGNQRGGYQGGGRNNQGYQRDHDNRGNQDRDQGYQDRNQGHGGQHGGHHGASGGGGRNRHRGVQGAGWKRN